MTTAISESQISTVSWFETANQKLDKKIDDWKSDWLLPHQSSCLGRIELSFLSPTAMNMARAAGKIFTHIAGSLKSITLELVRLVAKVALIAAKILEVIGTNLIWNLLIKDIVVRAFIGTSIATVNVPLGAFNNFKWSLPEDEKATDKYAEEALALLNRRSDNSSVDSAA